MGHSLKAESIFLSFSKFIRSFVLTMIAIITPYYLFDLGYGALIIGIVIALAVVLSTLFVYVFAYLKMPIRWRLLLLSTLFTISMGILYFFTGLLSFILSLAVAGITLSGRDMTPNETMEKFSISTYEKEQRDRNYAFSVYNFSSYGAGSLASLLIFLYGSGDLKTYFLIDLILAVLQFIPYIYVKFPERIERESPRKFDGKTRMDVTKLSYLFSMDAFGGGLVVTSVITLWFKTVYGISLSQAGLMFVIINIVTAVSIILSSFIAERLGLVRTMVYTHIISNIFLVLVPVFHTLFLSQVMLYLRQTTSQMDVPARDSFINTIIPAQHRVRSNSHFLAVRNGAQVPGPGVAGALVETYASSVFFLGGGIKILYDFLLFISYRNFRD